VFCRADHYSVGVVRVAEQLAKVDVLPSLGKLEPSLVETAFINVTEGDDVLTADLLGVVGAASACSDNGDVKLVREVLGLDYGRSVERE
jgi:hypothetical protein